MAVEHVFAPKTKPLGNLPLPTNAGTGPTILGAEWSGFKRADYPMVADRNAIVDLAGRRVLQNTLRAGDRAGYSFSSATGHFRNEVWRGDPEGIYLPGQTVYVEFAFMLPADFPVPEGGWGGLFQIHTPFTATGAYVSPMTIIRPLDGKLRLQNDAEGGVDFETDWALGRWHCWRLAVTMGRPGRVVAFYAVDRRPTSAQLVVDKSRNTCPTDAMHTKPDGSKTGSYTKGGLYLPPPSQAAIAAGRTYRHFRDVYVEAPAGLARAEDLFVANCSPELLGASPPPPPPPQDTLPLTIVTQDATSVTVGWTPPVNATGYRFRKDGGRWSHTWDGSRSQVKFGKPYNRLEVEALTVQAKGDLP